MKAFFKSSIRIFAVAQNTMTEAMRQRVFLVLFVFGVILIGGSHFLTGLAVIDQAKFLKDVGYAAISLTALVVGLVGAAFMIPAELERRTLHTLLSKPIYPAEYILGKYLGLVGIITGMMLMMGLLFTLLLFYHEHKLMSQQLSGWGGSPHTEAQLALEQIHAAFRDPQLFQAWLLIWAKACVLTAMALLLSTIATSTSFIVLVTLAIYFIGHLQQIVQEAWGAGQAGLIGTFFVRIIALFCPDFSAYNIIDEIIAGHGVGWSYLAQLLAYSGVYTSVLLVAAMLLFQRREL